MAVSLKIPQYNSLPEYQLNADLKLKPKQHEKLLDYILERVDTAHEFHSAMTDKFEAIDKEVAGYIRLTEEEKRNKKDTEAGRGPKPYTTSLQLTRTQLDEACTYIMNVFFPEEGPYTAIAEVEKQDVAKSLSTLMNKHSDGFKHYRTVNKAVFDGLKYNVGCWLTHWREIRGTVMENDAAHQPQRKENQVVLEGNELGYLNPYNTLFDPSIHPVDVATDGEFFGFVELLTDFHAKRAEANGLLYNLKALKTNTQGAKKYWTEMPDIVGDAIKGTSYSTNWVSILTGNGGPAMTKLSASSREFLTVFIWLPEKELNLSEAETYAIWRVVIADGKVIAAADKMDNAHGMLPCSVLMPWDDAFGSQTQGFAEILLPYQRFASFQMNMAQLAARKDLYGITVYNENVIPGLANADMIAGTVPFSGAIDGTDISKIVQQLSNKSTTQPTMQDVENMEALMQKMLPTNLTQQVASLERATQYQAAATVQSGNRRNLKIAKMIDIQAFEPSRRMQLYNIMEFQEAVSVLTPDGQSVEIKPSNLRDTDFIFNIGAGLRGIDKLLIIEGLKDVLFAIIQNPQASQKVDIVKLLDYITSLMGDYTDISQFVFQNEFDALTPEQKQIAMQLLQQATQAQAQEEGAPAPAQ